MATDRDVGRRAAVASRLHIRRGRSPPSKETTVAGNAYALLVGINAYPDAPLAGCLNDMQGLRDYLQHRFGSRLALEVLEDADATRDNIIAGFRTHLGRAGEDDVALFAYSGHGARSRSAPEFARFYPDGWDEGLVCVDSRQNGTPDLADKELAVLLEELAVQDPHVAVIMDCCHSGSATRGPGAPSAEVRVRQIAPQTDPRPLDTYLRGHYSRRLQHAPDLSVPRSRHIALAACDRTQTAKEMLGAGVFSGTLHSVLAGDQKLSYAELFGRCCVQVIRRLPYDPQDPQFDAYGGFNPYQGFLGGYSGRGARATVFYREGTWKMDRGAFMGLPADPQARVDLEIFEGERRIGVGHTVRVGSQESELDLQGETDRKAVYQAEILAMPVRKLAVFQRGEHDALEALARAASERAPEIEFVQDPAGTRYHIGVESQSMQEAFVLSRVDPSIHFSGWAGPAADSDERAIDYMLSVLRAAARFERLRGLDNRHTLLPRSEVEVSACAFPGQPDRVVKDADGELVVELPRIDAPESEWERAPVLLELSNRSTARDYHVVLFHFSEQLGVQALYHDPIPAGTTAELMRTPLFIEVGRTGAVEHLKVVVSERPLSYSLIEQPPVPLTPVASRGLETRGGTKNVHDDWFSISLTLRAVGLE